MTLVDKMRWKIRPQLENFSESASLADYVETLEKVLENLLSEGVCFEDERDFFTWTHEVLPLVKWTCPQTSPDLLSLHILCRASKINKIETLLLQLIKHRLVPDNEISILSFHHLYFHFENFPLESLLFIKVRVLIEDSGQLSLIQKNLPILAKETAHLVKAPRFGRDFLETKNLSPDFKTTLMHQDLSHLIRRFPHLFDQTLFQEHKRLLVLATKEFVEPRTARHLGKILAAHHVMHKLITRAASLFPEERHLQLRVAPTRLHFLFGTKTVVGLIITVYLLDRYEFFEEKHILLAVQKLIPSAQFVKGSFFTHHSLQDMIRTIYLEVEKRDGEPITHFERGMLKRSLPNELKASVEKLTPAVFMMRNEEEIMKNILILSQELKYASDLPQVMIAFEQQSSSDLLFTITLVRLTDKDSKPLDQLFEKVEPEAEFIPDRVQVVGYLRKKYPKEANTFRLKIPKEPGVLRADSSVNFYLARHKVIRILQSVIGEVRDYNGGMILQQVEQFSELKAAFPESVKKYPDLIEDFFYALTPIETQATLPHEPLCTLFRLLLDALHHELPKRESYIFKVEQKADCIFVLVRAKEASYREYVMRALNTLDIFPKALSSTHVDVQGSFCSGFIYDCEKIELQNKFLEALQQGVRGWREMSRLKALRLCCRYFPISLDPRVGGDEDSEKLLELLFEGLMRLDKDGLPAYAIAQSHEVSPKLKQYVFKLRETKWSNGDRVTAYDFEYSWKKILSPDFSTPFAYLFYPIKNAKYAKEGRVPLAEVGVKAVDDYTLIVELEHPTPYFLDLLAFPLYAPVNHRVDKIHPNWAVEEGKGYVCNGPFLLKQRSAVRGFELVRNPLFWDAQRIHLDQISITQNNNHTAVQMFKDDEIDWFGPPFNYWDSSTGNGGRESVEKISVPRIFWFVFNVGKFPFTNTKLRQAFAYALDRKILIETLGYGGSPALTPLPLAHTRLQGKELFDGNKQLAVQLFEEALAELGLKKSDFPVVKVIHAWSEVRNKTALLIKKQWEELFGIRCVVEPQEWNMVFDKMTRGDYQVGGMIWRTLINDPSYTLNVFRYASEKVNFAKWENVEYQKYLEAADWEIDTLKRLSFLAAAEEILLREMPVIPIFHEVWQYRRKKQLKVLVNPHTGRIDFSSAKVEDA